MAKTLRENTHNVLSWPKEPEERFGKPQNMESEGRKSQKEGASNLGNDTSKSLADLLSKPQAVQLRKNESNTA